MIIISCKSDPILGFQYLGIIEFPEEAPQEKIFVDKGSFKGSSRRRDDNGTVKGRQRQRDSKNKIEIIQ